MACGMWMEACPTSLFSREVNGDGVPEGWGETEDGEKERRGRIAGVWFMGGL
jgi:hypothetical protein